MTVANSLIDYINKNREWIFSGIGVSVLASIVLVLRHFIFGNRKITANKIPSKSKDIDDNKQSEWDVITPPNSKYKFISEKQNSIPTGVQTFTFEYSPYGHAHPLNLKGKIVRAEIQFSCQITNPYKAMFEANEYALNFLQPQFLLQARNVLEKSSLNNLREKRQEFANEIVAQQSEKFDEYGFKLLSVTIGAIEQINKPNKDTSLK